MANPFSGNGYSFTATAAQPPSSAGATTIASQAYGTGSNVSGNVAAGPSTPKNGTMILGVAGALILVFLWHSLPR